ncbi:MAG: cation:proton antiporter [Candidatus Micrarchaeota archaeon]
MITEAYIERIAGGGLLILAGLLAIFLNKKTKIPDVFFLMIIGFIAGPLLGIANPDNYSPLILLFTSLALAFLMFWVGTTLKIGSLLSGFKTNVVFTLVAYALTLALTFSLGSWMGFPFYSILLIAILMSDTCPTIVNSIVKTVKVTDAGKAGMVIESALSNSLGLALFLGIYPFAQKGSFEILMVVQSILSTFSIAILLGIAFSLLWLFFTRRIKDAEQFTWLTLAGLLVLYAGVEYLHAAAPISALIFGVLISNANLVEKKIGLAPKQPPFSVALQEHVLFFIKTAFFVYMGLLFPKVINSQLVLFAIAGLLLVGLLRFVLIKAIPGAVTKKDWILQTFAYPTGFSVVVLTFLPQSMGFTVPLLVEAIIYVVIISNLMSAFAAWIHSSQVKRTR